ncbi:hypothetical protein JMJ77_0006045 [Colletotrichum scovillei]|uniref:Uncharacterized protein n=1 Tax=Colletotrichum scovillei TaxID=1209932 RepID=A0A9P7UKX2_9PEZI|nr:hypothetical protein JMJ77_0006045 [Colletotrichum scovillei]KAG7077190.1 hypothetical protein JMJ76_0014440 [Colletotrichum scovillei]KAG7084387.1 hypothetical protein JMJ78_0009823 [Colletotrichum scovillei]
MGIDLCALHIVISASLPIQRPKLSIVEETNAGVWGAGCLEDLATSHTADSTSFPHAVRTLPDLDTQSTTAKGILSRAEYKRCSKPAIVRLARGYALSNRDLSSRPWRSRRGSRGSQPAASLMSVGMRQAGSQD